MQVRHKPLSSSKLRELAVRAECDPRSIEKVMRGLPVRPMVGDRIRRILAAEGVTPTQEPGGRHAA